MIPKGKLLALLLAFTAVGGLAATGAFTTVQADRTADVTAAGDSNALLAIDPASNTEFASNDSGDSQVELVFQDPEDSTGVNLDAETLDDEVIKITNNGNDEVTVFATASTQNNADLKFYVEQGDVKNVGEDAVTLKENVSQFPDNLPGNQRYVIDSEDDGVVLGTGESINLGLYLSTDGNVNQGDQLFAGSDPVTITANATDTANDGPIDVAT